MHNYPLDPTPDTLSLFTVYMCHHIKPNSVGTYLSGICHQLEPYFPDVRSSCNSTLVHRTLQGCKRMRAVPTSRKWALTIKDLETVVDKLSSSIDYDDVLFLAQLLTGFFALFWLGEMTYPDNPELWDLRKVTKCSSVQTNDISYKFFLPGHKADRFFEGNTIIIWKNPHKCFLAYLQARDAKFPFSLPLWLTSWGTIPTRSFFIKCLCRFFNSDTASQSLRAGGATSLAKNGVPPLIIQAIGRWVSDAFKIYVRKNPVLIQALLFGQTKHSQLTFLHALENILFFFFLSIDFSYLLSPQQTLLNGLFSTPICTALCLIDYGLPLYHWTSCTFKSLPCTYLHLSPLSSHPSLHELITFPFLFK